MPENAVEKSVMGLSDAGTGALDVVVDVSGAVNKPGLYKINEGSRVGDAVALAGGISSDASIIYVSKILNLAQKIHDSEKIYIPFEMDFTSDDSYEVSSLVVKLSSGFSTSFNQNLGNSATLGSTNSVSPSPSQSENPESGVKI